MKAQRDPVIYEHAEPDRRYRPGYFWLAAPALTLLIGLAAVACGGTTAEDAEGQCREALEHSAERAAIRAGAKGENAARHAANIARGAAPSFLARCEKKSPRERERYVNCLISAEDTAEARSCEKRR